jgi:hypothetical protein
MVWRGLRICKSVGDEEVRDGADFGVRFLSGEVGELQRQALGPSALLARQADRPVDERPRSRHR